MPVDPVAAGALGPEIFRLAVEICPGGMLVTDADGRMLLVNREVERLFGYVRDELLGKPVEVLLPASVRAKHAGHRRGYTTHPEARHFGTGRDFNGRRKDGSEFPIEVGLNPCHVDGKFMVVGAIVDISERKRLASLQDEFVSIVSHELRTPITSIAASLGLLLVDAAKSLPQPAAHLLEIAHANCLRLVRLVNDILDIKKLEAGQMPFRFQRCDANSLLEKAIEANRAFASNVRIRFDAPPESAELYVDPDRFMQVITNLLSNALKFSPPGEAIVAAIEKHGDNIHITVRDHGPGIPTEFKPRMFEKFAQAEGAHGQQKAGTGLGLSIVREIVMRMHGHIGFDDAPDGGTEFYIDLPDADHAPPAESPDGPDPASQAECAANKRQAG